MKRFIVAAVLLTIPAMASADNWYVYYGKTQHCESGERMALRFNAPLVSTPYGFRKYERDQHGYRGLTIEHPAGTKWVIFNFPGYTVNYFSSGKICHIYAKIQRDDEPLGELK